MRHRDWLPKACVSHAEEVMRVSREAVVGEPIGALAQPACLFSRTERMTFTNRARTATLALAAACGVGALTLGGAVEAEVLDLTADDFNDASGAWKICAPEVPSRGARPLSHATQDESTASVAPNFAAFARQAWV